MHHIVLVARKCIAIKSGLVDKEGPRLALLSQCLLDLPK